MELENTDSEEMQWPVPFLKVYCIAEWAEGQSWCDIWNF